jgi:SAM-dependent methyltransferase
MEATEYLKLAEVEDRMWYFRALHGNLALGFTAAGLPAKPAILDAGCGTGGLLLQLQRRLPGARLSGVDFAPLACELARERCGPAIDIKQGSITALPFADESFDGVVSADVVCQVDDEALALREFFRVLRPGGVAVINMPAYAWMWSYHDEAVANKRRYARGELARLVRAAGFAIERLTYWNAIPFPLVWAKRKLLPRDAGVSDVSLFPRPIEAAFNGVMAIEHAWLRAGANWAWGASVLAVGRKPRAPHARPMV